MTTWTLRKRTPAEARSFLRARYQTEAQRWPLLRDAVTKEQYVAANLRYARRYYAQDGAK